MKRISRSLQAMRSYITSWRGMYTIHAPIISFGCLWSSSISEVECVLTNEYDSLRRRGLAINSANGIAVSQVTDMTLELQDETYRKLHLSPEDDEASRSSRDVIVSPKK